MKKYILAAVVYSENGFPMQVNYYLGNNIPIPYLWELADKLKNFLYYDWVDVKKYGIIPIDSLPPEAQADVMARVEKTRRDSESAQFQILKFLESIQFTESEPRQQRENFKLPKGREGIDILLKILNYLSDGKRQKWIADKIGFHYTLWNKKCGLGDCLRKLKQRANQSEENRKRLITRATDGVEDVEDEEYAFLKGNPEADDFLFCSTLLNELNEEKLYTKIRKKSKEIPVGKMNDRGGWNRE